MALALPAPALALPDPNVTMITPGEIPDVGFTDDAGTPHRVKAEKGKLTLVHFWATWCGPCVREFPLLNALAGDYGDKGLKIFPISLDGRRSVSQVRAFYSEHAITHLPILIDDGASVQALKLRGMPTTLFLDAEGREIAFSEGPVDWTNPKMRAIIEHYLK